MDLTRSFRSYSAIFVTGCLILVTGCFREEQVSAPQEQTPVPQPPSQREKSTRFRGDWCPVKASFYGSGDGFAGQKTASGEKFNPGDLTAAHRTLPFGSRVSLRNPDNGNEIVVRINDRGPMAKGREIDLSMRAAKELGIVKEGVADLEMKVQ